MERRSKAFEGLIHFLQTLCDLLLLNLFWVVCSLPILTAGTATCALFSVTLKLARDEYVETIKDFFKGFKVNFKHGTVLGLIVLLAAFILYVDISFAFAQEGTFRIVFFVVCGIFTALLLTFITYVFALQARYENSVKSHIKNAFLLALCAPGKTILMWIVYAIPIALVILLPFEVVLNIGFLFFLFGISAPVYINSKILIKVFDIFKEKDDILSNE